MFAQMWPKLIKAAATEAFAERDAKKPSTAAISPEYVREFFQRCWDGKLTQKDINSRTRLVTREAPTTILFDTRDLQQPGIWVHLNYLTVDPSAPRQPVGAQPLQINPPTTNAPVQHPR